MEWIAVKDRLPEEGKKIMFLDDSLKYPDNCFTGIMHRNEKWFKSSSYVVNYSKVTHWMLLPEPPKQ
tara:strand:- start:2094 stop:2294 length:201 start_codon:yes stop_codon:yes gene_type:complete